MSERKGNTFHEAGHAVMMIALGRRIRIMSIIPDEDSYARIVYDRFRKVRLGPILYTVDRSGRQRKNMNQLLQFGKFQPKPRQNPRVRDRVEAEILIALAGSVAEAKALEKRKTLMGRDLHVAARALVVDDDAERGDWAYAKRMALVICAEEEERQKYLDYMMAKTVNLITFRPHWEAVERLAARLGEQGEMTGEEIRDVFFETMGVYWKSPGPGESRRRSRR